MSTIQERPADRSADSGQHVESLLSNSRVLRRPALLAAGYTDPEIAGMRRTHKLTRLQPGFYCTTSALDADRFGLTTHAHRAQAAALSSPSLVLSHLSAAVLHDLPIYRVNLDRVHLTRTGRGGGRRSASRQEHTGKLPDRDVVTVRGVRATGIARTLVDLARTESLRTATVATDHALHHDRVAADDVVTHLSDARLGRGCPRARRALAAVDGRSENPGETLTRLALSDCHLVPPVLQLWIYDECGILVGRSDFAYPDAGVLVEFDGRTKYEKFLRPGQTALDAVLEEKRREESITALGWLVIRVTWAELRHPESLAGRIRRAIADRRRLVAAGILRGTTSPTPAKTLTF